MKKLVQSVACIKGDQHRRHRDYGEDDSDSMDDSVDSLDDQIMFYSYSFQRLILLNVSFGLSLFLQCQCVDYKIDCVYLILFVSGYTVSGSSQFILFWLYLVLL